ncbi:MAG: hypothetical protein K0Q87_3660 [Neobacillus sp.]|jgi:hypothetical protein|nr:hypothetical protein [Neobacillus sp.]
MNRLLEKFIFTIKIEFVIKQEFSCYLSNLFFEGVIIVGLFSKCYSMIIETT